MAQQLGLVRMTACRGLAWQHDVADKERETHLEVGQGSCGPQGSGASGRPPARTPCSGRC